jgi:diadenosine tetraphosphatase ApaH/serine/threonine PP2A family protein phosphatase
VPGIITEDIRFLNPKETDGIIHLDGRKTLINVGFVGQPRDGDWRACYAILKDNTVCFRRVEYDIAITVKKIRNIDDLDDFSGDRLGDGR